MADTVILDAMINRDDFAVKGPPSASAEPIKSLSIESLGPMGMLIALLRKPDFQRETNHWTPVQLLSFLKSFLDNELIPSIILWQSESFVFVIDGAHRLSALRAWIEDDYGDGQTSLKFFSNEISRPQRRAANKARALVEKQIGKYTEVKSALLSQNDCSQLQIQRAKNMATRSLSLQWVTGDADKAETSFFKINTQGTPLDDAEELLLRNRHKATAIAARSIVRSATGNKYWSNFDKTQQSEIEKLAKNLHEILFNPEVDSPIKTLDLPLGGSKSPIRALEFLINLISITTAQGALSRTSVESLLDDSDGSETIQTLKRCLAVTSWMAGNGPSSLGLHPAVYFYSDRGRHIPDLFLGISLLFRRKLDNNYKDWFSLFTKHRAELESILIENKSLITQALQAARSQTRFERVSDLIESVTKSLSLGDAVAEEQIVSVIVPGSVSKVLSVRERSGGPSSFSDDTKSAIFISQSLRAAVKCPICGGLIDPGKSVSYDHIERVRDGGLGTHDNGQLTHPYCNSSIKN